MQQLLPFPVLEAATQGDPIAINYIVKHYAGYIAVLATKKVYAPDGTVYTAVDDELRQKLETKLITKILKFKIK